MKYLLDTNICIYLIKKKPIGVIKRLSEIDINEVGISSITLSELEYGIEKSSNPEKNRLALTEFLALIDVYDFNNKSATEYGKIRAEFENNGLIIGPFDMLIAAHAKSLELILVTNNVKEFKRTSNLNIENWVS